MEGFKKILYKLFFLPLLATVLIALPSFLFVFAVLILEIQGAAAYLSYVLSAYGLIITITKAVSLKGIVTRGVQGHPLVKKVSGTSLGGRFLQDKGFRTEVSLYQGFFINLFYIVMKLVMGIYYKSLWFLSLASYYSLLAIMRFLLLRHVNRSAVGTDITAEWRRYRICGVMLLFMTLVLANMIGYMIYENRSYEYPGTLIYAVAAYAFYAVTVAMISLIKFRKRGSPILSAAKAIHFVAAMVSILALETAMTAQFGAEDDLWFRRTMTKATGGGVCTIVLGMAIYMIVNATKQLNRRSRHE